MNPPLDQTYRRFRALGPIALRLCVPALLAVGVLTVVASVPASATRAVRASNVKGEGPAYPLVSVTPSSPNCSNIGPDADLQGCDLSGANLSGANLSGATLSGANLSGANLSDADLEAAGLTGANLTGANLTGASLYFAYMSDVTLTGANLSGANLAHAILTGVVSGGIIGAPGALPEDWSLVNGYLVGPLANLTGANLTDANLGPADLNGATLTDANLSGADLSGVDLNRVISGGITGTPSALPSGWVLVNGYLIGLAADLTDANLSGADLTDANLEFAVLNGATLSNANLSGSELSGADLYEVSSGGIIGTPSTFPSASWSIVNGYLVGPGANLTDATLSGADLSGIDLTTSNLTGANLTGANLRGVIWSDTICPDGTNSNNDGDTCVPISNVLIPSKGATLSGSTYLDASASNATSVVFLLFGGTYGFSGHLVGTATSTIYGWLDSWNTTTVPNGSYVLLSYASGPGGNTVSSGVSITVRN